MTRALSIMHVWVTRLRMFWFSRRLRFTVLFPVRAVKSLEIRSGQKQAQRSFVCWDFNLCHSISVIH